MNKNKEMSSTIIYICEVCGNPIMDFDAIESVSCNICGSNRLRKTDLKENEVIKAKKRCEWNNVLKRYFYESQVCQMTKYTNDMRIEKQEAEGYGNHITDDSIQKQGNECFPECPTCHSKNIEKIGAGEKVVSGVLWGLFSSKIHKTFICKNCGYKW